MGAAGPLWSGSTVTTPLPRLSSRSSCFACQQLAGAQVRTVKTLRFLAKPLSATTVAVAPPAAQGPGSQVAEGPSVAPCGAALVKIHDQVSGSPLGSVAATPVVTGSPR